MATLKFLEAIVTRPENGGYVVFARYVEDPNTFDSETDDFLEKTYAANASEIGGVINGIPDQIETKRPPSPITPAFNGNVTTLKRPK